MRGTSCCRRSAGSGSESSRRPGRRHRRRRDRQRGHPGARRCRRRPMTIIDYDVVELANLHRQPLFRKRDVGYPKAELRAQFVQRLNHFVEAHAGPAADRRGQCAPSCSPAMIWSSTAATISRLGWRSATPACARHSAGVGGGRSVPGPGRAVPLQALLSLLRRQCVRCRGLRQLRGAGRARRADGDGRQLRGAARDQPIVGIGENQAGKVHLFDGEKLEWRAITIPPDPGCRACGSA